MPHSHAHPRSVEASFEDLGPCHHRVRIRVPAARVQEEIEHALRHAAQGVKIQGFRPGKVPASVLRRMLGEDAVQEAREHLFQHVIPEGFESAGLRVLRLLDFDPSGIEVDEEKDLEFSFECETVPEPELPPWEEISVEAKSTEATAEQVDQAIQQMGGENPAFDPTEEGAALDDETLAECSIVFTRGEEEGPAAKDLKLGLGSPLYGTDPEAWERALRGAKAGDEKELEVEFKEGFEKEDWVGSKGTVRIVVDSLVRPRPATETELVERLDVENAERLRERIAQQIGAHLEREERSRQVWSALEEMCRIHPFELPSRLVREETDSALEEQVQRMTANGAEEAEARAELEKMRDKLEEEAVTRLRHYFLIRRISQRDGIRVNRNDLDQAFRELGKRHGADPKTVQAFYEEKGWTDRLVSDILEEKVRRHIWERLQEQQQGALESAPAAE